MFSATLLLSFATLTLGLSTGDLKVSVSAVQPVVNSIDDIVISAVVTNPTSHDIKVFAKNNILDSAITPSFQVSKDGKDVIFTGLRATYNFDEPSLYKTIPAGASVAVNHTDLSPLFDFETHGTGKFVFNPNTMFQSGLEDNAIKVPANPIDVTVKNDVAKRQLPGISNQKRAADTSTPSCSDSGRLQVLTDSLTYARSMAGGAASDIRAHPDSTQWNSYFGGDDHDEIWYRMDTIAGDLDSRSGKRTIHCTGDTAGACAPNSGVIAYTLVVTSNGAIVGSDIYTCDYFFTSTGTTPSICTNGYDATQSSRGGVILHELSHATAGTADISYGCSNTAKLSAADKRNNADNYRCMGAAIYYTYNCPH
ncbi:hypothetical protein CPB83DRAFT_800412 [Crepidotus variabilis]|uniref:Lysine-specific metallo-endopeptidase domain-containing protein n=1 Tax=Crepidotus variabilis TaxID=179855 RepID=A0A9P6JJ53_9AGAR|nr:hypothetical protein CPB83DRAFT_800412 [Crepidotus variabilis]